MRKLINNRDFNTIPPSTDFWTQDDPDTSRLPFPLYGFYMDNTANRGEGQLHALQLELRRRWKGGLAANVAYTLAHSDGTVPDTGFASLGPGDVRQGRHREGPRTGPERREAPPAGERDLGHPGRPRAQARSDMAGWADALFGGWTVSTIFQARSGNNLTPFFSSFYTTSPWNTGQALDGLGVNFCCAWRRTRSRTRTSAARATPSTIRRRTRCPRPACSATPRRGSLLGPGTWVVNFGVYKDIVTDGRFRLQLSAIMDNAFNHPQFYPFYGDGFSQVDSWVIDAEPDNGTMANLGSGAIANQEGFSPGRVVRIGLRATF
jgi:hypothetical protein